MVAEDYVPLLYMLLKVKPPAEREAPVGAIAVPVTKIMT
jgi:hypothetical protein